MSNYLVPNYKYFAIDPLYARGVWVTTKNGELYLDLTGGIAVTCLGHCHPALLKTLENQAHLLWHTSNYFTSIPTTSLAQKLTELTFAEQVFFANSGSEANEAALKLSRLYAVKNFGAEKNQIHAFFNAFHGRTLFTVSAGGNKSYKEGFGALPDNISHTKFNDLAELKNVISEKSCAVILELIQGEGGVCMVQLEFLKEVRRLCDRYKVCLIFDEVQTGVSRTGAFYAYQHFGVEPDILTTAKALGGGFPISAMLTKKKIAKVFQPGVHGTTFGGNPLACAVAQKVVEIVTTEEFLKDVRSKSKFFFSGLRKLQQEYNIFSEIRGLGLMIGVQLKSKYTVQDFLQYTLQQKLLVLPAGDNVIRLLPALNISEQEIAEGLRKFELALKNFLNKKQ